MAADDHRPPFPRRIDWLLLSVGLLLLYVFCLGARGLNEPDEGRYANIARAMVLGGDWWEPRMSGFGHYDKPPLVYWITAVSLRVFGMNEWAARVPPFLGAMMSLAGLGWAAWRLRGARVAWFSVLLCGASVQFFALGRILCPDMLLTGWCTLALAAWAECRHRGGAWSWWLLSLAFWTCAWWTKATPAFIPLAGLYVGLLATRDIPGRRALRVWLLLPAILVLGAAWFVSMMTTHPELKHFFFGRELAGRMTGHADGRRGSMFYYLGVSAVAWLPWWPLAAWSVWTNRVKLRVAPGVSVLKVWCGRLGVEGWIVGTGLLIFSLASSKLPTYTLPLAPWAALLMARLLASSCSGSERRPWYWNQTAVAAGGFVLIALAGALIIPKYESGLGVNSSLRRVCEYLKNRGAKRVVTDQYWPGMEFYLGSEPVMYVVDRGRQQERSTDPGLTPPLFIETKTWRAAETRPTSLPAAERDVWLVRFRKRRQSPFDFLLIGKEGQHLTKTIGQFELLHVQNESEGGLTLIAAEP